MFSLANIITAKITEANIPIEGSAYAPLRLDFPDEITEEQRTEAMEIANQCIADIAVYEAQYEEEKASLARFGGNLKFKNFADLLISKNIITEEDIDTLGN